jgi:hypothetical protein
MELRSEEYSGMEPSPLWRVPFAAAVTLCWKAVINMAAASRSSIPPLFASICSNVPGSMEIEGFEGVVVEDEVFGPLFFRVSGWRRSPSLAWTVRSWRGRRSRRTKVDLHFPHLQQALQGQPSVTGSQADPPAPKRVYGVMLESIPAMQLCIYHCDHLVSRVLLALAGSLSFVIRHWVVMAKCAAPEMHAASCSPSTVRCIHLRVRVEIGIHIGNQRGDANLSSNGGNYLPWSFPLP